MGNDKREDRKRAKAIRKHVDFVRDVEKDIAEADAIIARSKAATQQANPAPTSVPTPATKADIAAETPAPSTNVQDQTNTPQFKDYKAPLPSASGKEINWAAGPRTKELQRIAGPSADKSGYTLEQIGDSLRYKVKAPEYQENISKVTLKLPNVVSSTNPVPTGGIEASPTARLEQARWDEILKKHQEENKPKTLSDLLEKDRKKAETDKTDAAKMQKYYALADAFNALGKMGGAAIGGAIGGDIVGGAPTVAEYQPSKGYIDAFEKAKNANERLRALDDKEFNLAVRDEERSYNQQVAKADRDFKAQQAQLDRDWQMTFYDYKSKIEQANAQSNLKLKNDLEKELLAIENKFKAQYQAIANAHEEKLKNLSLDIVKLQNQGSNELVAFDDGTTMSIPESYYKSMFNYFNGKEINGMYVDKDNFAEFVRKNPKQVSSFLNLFNQKLAANGTPAATAETPFPLHMSQVPVENMKASQTSSLPAAKTPSNEPVVDEDGIEWI